MNSLDFELHITVKSIVVIVEPLQYLIFCLTTTVDRNVIQIPLIKQYLGKLDLCCVAYVESIALLRSLCKPKRLSINCSDEGCMALI